MKSGVRAVGVAASDSATGAETSVLCGAVVRADRVVDGCAFETCTVGGTDATRAVNTLIEDLDREDARYVMVAGVAPAWFNLIDLREVAEETRRTVLAVSFEESAGLEPALREAFDGDALDRRLAIYRDLPPRQPLHVNGEQVFVRAVGCDDDAAAEIVRGFTPEGGRPEPLRVARVAARGARRWLEREEASRENGRR